MRLKLFVLSLGLFLYATFGRAQNISDTPQPQPKGKISCEARYEDEAQNIVKWKHLDGVDFDPDYFEAVIENYSYSADTYSILTDHQISLMIMDTVTKRSTSFTAAMIPTGDGRWYADMNYYDITPKGTRIVLNLVCQWSEQRGNSINHENY